jgi:MoxR-like ATPase
MGRDYVIPDDIKALAEPALAHRLIIKTSASIHDVQSANVVRELLDSTPIEGIRPTGGSDRARGVQPTETVIPNA